MRLRKLTLVLTGFLTGLVVALLLPMGASEASAEVLGQQSLQQLVEGAKKEGRLRIFGGQQLRDKREEALFRAFKGRFGLDIRVDNDNTTTEGPKFSEALVEHHAGLPPTFDAVQGVEDRVIGLLEAGAIQRIDNWETLLREISPEAFKVRHHLSPMGFSGYGFQWLSRVKVINYNPRLISKDELPQTRAAMGDPKYQGMYSLPPFVSEALYGPLVYPKAQWLDIVRSWGAWKPPIVHYAEGIKRMLLGAIRFLPSNDYYLWEVKARDAEAPIGMSFFKDLTPIQFGFYFVRKGARHPNVATLFVLWMSTPEANRVLEDVDTGSPQANLNLGTGPISRQIMEALNRDKVKPVSWYDSEKHFELFRWYRTTEGQAYAKELVRAQTGRK